jgi:Icc-related predicted phosphoesterase
VKILAFSDIHGDIKRLNEIIKVAKRENVDFVVLAGDITFFDRTIDYYKMLEPFFKERIKLLVIPGNHDSNKFLSKVIKKLKERYKFNEVYNLEKNYFEKDDFIFVGFSANNMGPTLEVYNEEEAKEILEELFNKIKNKLKNKKLITISHIHPEGKISETWGYEGSLAWTEFIKKFKPTLHLHGHIHEAEGTEYKIKDTKVFNLGPRHYLFDLNNLNNSLK